VTSSNNAKLLIDVNLKRGIISLSYSNWRFDMPGSYPDPRSYADTALYALEEAYEENYNSHTGSLILKAIEALKHLKQEVKTQRSSGLSEYDPYDINESNSAI
jgi:hypothetical protein